MVDMAAVVTAKRQQAQFFMPDTVTITDPGTVTPTSDGGTEIANGGSLVTVGRLVRAGTQSVIEVFGTQVAAQADYVLYLPHGTTLQEGWSVAIGGVVFTVIAVAKAGAWQVMVRAALVISTPIGG